MIIKKKIKCVKCEKVVEENGQCECGNVILSENKVIKGLIEIDYKDLSKKLLVE